MVVWGVLIRNWTPKGFIVLKDLPDQAMVIVDDKKVTVHWPDGGEPAEIAVTPGDYMVQVKKDGLEMSGDEVTVEAGGKRRSPWSLIPPATPGPRKMMPMTALLAQGLPSHRAPPATGAVVTTSPAPPPIRAEGPDSNSTVVVDNKDGKVDAAKRCEWPAQVQANDVADCEPEGEHLWISAGRGERARSRTGGQGTIL